MSPPAAERPAEAAQGVERPAEAALGASDTAAVARQLGRAPRALLGVAHRCACGLPDVVTTAPRLPDGSPFPTLYYLTCPRARVEVGRLEAGGVMREMTARLREDPRLAEAYRQAGEAYRRDRDRAARATGVAPLPAEFPLAGGMPDRVKCLHVAVAHSLAVGPGVNPIGDEALDLVADWGGGGACVGDPA
jgi:hypothetical protein